MIDYIWEEAENVGWGMDGGWRRRGEINMALIVSSAPLPSLDQPFITPTQSVRHWHFGKWGSPLSLSVKQQQTQGGVCVWGRVRVLVMHRQQTVWNEWEIVWHTRRWWHCSLLMSLSSHSQWLEAKPHTFFIFSSFGATPSISRAKSNGKSWARAFCTMLMLRCTRVWKASRQSSKAQRRKTPPWKLLLLLLSGSKEAF